VWQIAKFLAIQQQLMPLAEQTAPAGRCRERHPSAALAIAAAKIRAGHWPGGAGPLPEPCMSGLFHPRPPGPNTSNSFAVSSNSFAV
jgi:hypothetical protein